LIFIDWLSIYQDFSGKNLPVFGSEKRFSVDLETGDLISSVVVGKDVVGSYDSSIRVRCDGNRVSVSGNPSRFGRSDNLFGFQSVDDAVGLYNRLLRHLGLPEFFECEHTHVRFQSLSDHSVIWQYGARITAIHVTQNLAVSSPELFLRGLSGVVYLGVSPGVYGSGSTVGWYGSRRYVVKYYLKGAELRAHSAPVEVVDWALERGIVRYEIELKSTELGSRGLQRLGAWSSRVLGDLVKEFSRHSRLRVEKEVILSDVVGSLVAAGVSRAEAERADTYLQAWLAGKDVFSSMSRNTAYKYRRRLLLLGIDIRVPCDVRRLSLKVVRPSVSVASPPSWYQLPTVEGVSLG
jgi:hypothetical protein